ncbi:hypothetical protein CRG98_045072 [Punica granatum]|uniref:Uncharacterized protein n=1 Tax=Punica granatum TaxID=22663 RepID=A0A2I0HS37_PUNGR|nr:hypothetical protein CRG98_045072 [Punica granatum]
MTKLRSCSGTDAKGEGSTKRAIRRGRETFSDSTIRGGPSSSSSSPSLRSSEIVMSLAFTTNPLRLPSLLHPLGLNELTGLLEKETEETPETGENVGKLEQEQGQEEEEDVGFIERGGETMVVVLVGIYNWGAELGGCPTTKKTLMDPE